MSSFGISTKSTNYCYIECKQQLFNLLTVHRKTLAVPRNQAMAPGVVVRNCQDVVHRRILIPILSFVGTLYLFVCTPSGHIPVTFTHLLSCGFIQPQTNKLPPINTSFLYLSTYVVKCKGCAWVELNMHASLTSIWIHFGKKYIHLCIDKRYPLYARSFIMWIALH